jgi:hypothetical protein
VTTTPAATACPLIDALPKTSCGGEDCARTIDGKLTTNAATAIRKKIPFLVIFMGDSPQVFQLNGTVETANKSTKGQPSLIGFA